jgi:hypothetical protein
MSTLEDLYHEISAAFHEAQELKEVNAKLASEILTLRKEGETLRAALANRLERPSEPVEMAVSAFDEPKPPLAELAGRRWGVDEAYRTATAAALLAEVTRLAGWLDHIGSVACTYKTCDEYCQEICRMLACAKRGEEVPS